jgi:hypothetical protein
MNEFKKLTDLDRQNLEVEIVPEGPNSRRIKFIPKRVGE